MRALPPPNLLLRRLLPQAVRYSSSTNLRLKHQKISSDPMLGSQTAPACAKTPSSSLVRGRCINLPAPFAATPREPPAAGAHAPAVSPPQSTSPRAAIPGANVRSQYVYAKTAPPPRPHTPAPACTHSTTANRSKCPYSPNRRMYSTICIDCTGASDRKNLIVNTLSSRNKPSSRCSVSI